VSATHRFSRRQFLLLAASLGVSGVTTEAFALEPHRLRVRPVRLSAEPRTRFVTWSDFHYRGEEAYAQHTVDLINRLAPDFVCFVGDLIDDRKYQAGALDFIRQIKVPVWGVPGNHDYHSRSSFADNRRVFSATGGGWLVNRVVQAGPARLTLCGSAERYVGFLPQEQTEPRVLLSHYPITANETMGRRFAAILAGHSHGGQIRLPFYGAIALPRYVGRYQWGRYDTPGGPLYVTCGVGTYQLPARFNCPPELALIEL
jgi:hypothetical protein